MVDYKAKYEVDYLDWEVFGGIEAVGGVLFPQQTHEFVVTSNEGTLFGNLSVHRSHWAQYSVAYRTHGRVVRFDRA